MIYTYRPHIMKKLVESNFKFGSIILGPDYKEDDYEAMLNKYYPIKSSKHKLVDVDELGEGDVIFISVTNTTNDETTAVKAKIDKVSPNEVGEIVVVIDDIVFRFDKSDKVFKTILKK